MQWSGEANGGFSTAAPEALYAPVINDPVYGYTSVNVEAAHADPSSLLHIVKALIAARKAQPVLADGALDWLDDLPKEALCFWRRGDSVPALLALHNLSPEALTVSLPAGAFAQVFPPAEAVHSAEATLPPYGYLWLSPNADG